MLAKNELSGIEAPTLVAFQNVHAPVTGNNAEQSKRRKKLYLCGCSCSIGILKLKRFLPFHMGC